MAICKTCGKKYSKWATPVSARGVCCDCFEVELRNEREVEPQQQLSSRATASAEVQQRAAQDTAARVWDFFELWFGFVICRVGPLLALLALLAWVGLGKLGVNNDIRSFIVAGLSVLMAFLTVWFFVRANRQPKNE
jgi:hypothetical protein